MFCLQEVAAYYSTHAQSPQRWHTPRIIEDLKVRSEMFPRKTIETISLTYLCVQVKAREVGLWNLFLPAVSGLSQLDYAYIAEETGRCLFAPEVFNCQAPGGDRAHLKPFSQLFLSHSALITTNLHF